MNRCFIPPAGIALALAILLAIAHSAEPPTKITIDGKFDDWAALPKHADPANDEHDTDHKERSETPEHVEHADVDILETKFTHDADNLYAYFKARGTIGRTQAAGPGKPAGRYYAIVTIDVDQDERTGYWLHEGGFYPTSGGYDVNCEIEWYSGRDRLISSSVNLLTADAKRSSSSDWRRSPE